MKLYFGLLFMGLLGLSACQSEETKAKQDAEAMANELCACLRPMYELSLQMEQMDIGKDSTAALALVEDAMRISAESDTCALHIEAKYGMLLKDKNDMAEVAFKKACPDIDQFLSQEVEEAY